MMSQTNVDADAAGPVRPAGGDEAEERPSASPPIEDDGAEFAAGAPPGSNVANDEDPPRGTASLVTPAELAAAHEIHPPAAAAAAAGASSKGHEKIDDLEAQDLHDSLQNVSDMTVNEIIPPAPLNIANLEDGKSKTTMAAGGFLAVNEIIPPAPLNIANLEGGKSKVAPAQNTVAFDRTSDYSQIVAKSRAEEGGAIPSTSSSEHLPRAAPGPSEDPEGEGQRTPAASATIPEVRPPPPSMLPRDPSESERAESPVPLFHTVEAHRVEEGPVYDAIQLEEEHWAKRHQKKIIGGFVLIIAALAVALGVAFGTGGNDDGNDTAQVVVLVASSPPSSSASPSFSPTMSFPPSGQPTMYPRRCFVDRNELKAAVDEYTAGGVPCFAGASTCEVIQTYGWPIGTWCVSNITDMSELFSGNEDFVENLLSWDTSKVTSMNRMFLEASSFNGDVKSWNTSSVTDMSYMFDGASSFDGDLSNWNTASVTDMRQMFSSASSFNGDVSNWDTSKVSSMAGMFWGASSFNRDVLNWNTAYVTDMTDMFSVATSFDGDVSKWDTSRVTSMTAMFMFARAFNGDVSNWKLSSVTDMSYMFAGVTAFNQNLCAWGNAFPYDAAEDIFRDSGCTFQGRPQSTQKGPFCASSCPDNSMPSASPSISAPPSASSSPTCSFVVGVNIFTDIYPEETSWTLSRITPADDGDLMPECVIVLEGSPENPFSHHRDEVCLGMGNYQFTIYDSAQDGLFYGGYYNITIDGEVIARGGDFGAEETVSFSIPLAPSSSASKLVSPEPSGSCSNTVSPTCYDMGISILFDSFPFGVGYVLSKVESDGGYTDIDSFFSRDDSLANEQYSKTICLEQGIYTFAMYGGPEGKGEYVLTRNEVTLHKQSGELGLGEVMIVEFGSNNK